jgi:hypothetical protein
LAIKNWKPGSSEFIYNSGRARDAPYAKPSYAAALKIRGSFMDESELGITDKSKRPCQTLLKKKQTTDALFRDDPFTKTFGNVLSRNEAGITRGITPLLVPSAETLAIYGGAHLKNLIESNNQAWNFSIPGYGPRPQPDYSAGFDRSAFTDEQYKCLHPFIGEFDAISSHYMGKCRSTSFLMCESKASPSILEKADRQNAHSMTIAVGVVVGLFRLVNR